MWVKYKDILIFLQNITHIERRGRTVIFHYLNAKPLLLPFENQEQAKKWFEGFFLMAKSGNIPIDTSDWEIH